MPKNASPAHAINAARANENAADFLSPEIHKNTDIAPDAASTHGDRNASPAAA